MSCASGDPLPMQTVSLLPEASNHPFSVLPLLRIKWTGSIPLPPLFSGPCSTLLIPSHCPARVHMWDDVLSLVHSSSHHLQMNPEFILMGRGEASPHLGPHKVIPKSREIPNTRKCLKAEPVPVGSTQRLTIFPGVTAKGWEGCAGQQAWLTVCPSAWGQVQGRAPTLVLCHKLPVLSHYPRRRDLEGTKQNTGLSGGLSRTQKSTWFSRLSYLSLLKKTCLWFDLSPSNLLTHSNDQMKHNS